MKPYGIGRLLSEGCEMHIWSTRDGSIGIALLRGAETIAVEQGMSVVIALAQIEKHLCVEPESSILVENNRFTLPDLVSLMQRLNARLCAGDTLMACGKGGEIVVQLHGSRCVAVPLDVLEQAVCTGFVQQWSTSRGYTYVTKPDPHRRMVGNLETTVLRRPEGADLIKDWKYRILQLGFGESFFAACEDALGAEENEVCV